MRAKNKPETNPHHRIFFEENRKEGNPLKVHAVAISVKKHQDIPLIGVPGDCYYLENINRLVEWDEERQDWKILTLNQVEDRYNDRRGAILAQRERKKHERLHKDAEAK
jgi:hypothetical protein